MTSWIPRGLSTLALSFPVAVWVNDSIFSLYTVRGTSMEPSLRDGDVILVRKADVASFLVPSKSEEDVIMRTRILQREGGARSLLLARPPMVTPGDVVVFASPSTAFPNEYHIKRVMGIGGQMVQ